MQYETAGVLERKLPLLLRASKLLRIFPCSFLSCCYIHVFFYHLIP